MASRERYGEAAARVYRLAIDPIVRPLRPRVAAALAGGSALRVLDIGCATGDQARILAQRGLQPVGVDLSPAMIAAAARRSPHVPFVCGSALALPFPDAAFDAAILSLALHEHDENERRAMVAEALRVLHPAGTLVIADFREPRRPRWHLPWLVIRAIERSSGLEHRAGFADYVSHGSLEGLLDRCGLTPQAVRGSHFGCIGIAIIQGPFP
ncbi:MAG: class I SAM-dependent methyltransferase [Candidatus Bipolaricaulota bacterium]